MSVLSILVPLIVPYGGRRSPKRSTRSPTIIAASTIVGRRWDRTGVFDGSSLPGSSFPQRHYVNGTVHIVVELIQLSNRLTPIQVVDTGPQRSCSSMYNLAMAAPKTVSKALRLLELVRLNPGQRVSELSIAAGFPMPTCSRLLEALTDARLVRRRNGRYELGPHCLALAESFREVFNLNHDARVYLEHLADLTGETAHIGVVDDLECVYVDKVDSPHSIRMYSKVGARSPLHSTGIGKALLSASPEDLLVRVCEAGLERRTSRTIIDPDRLGEEIRLIRLRGYAIDDVENEDGIRCVAAPVRGPDGLAVAAISVAGPDTRLSMDLVPEVSIHVMSVADDLASLVGFTGEPLSDPA